MQKIIMPSVKSSWFDSVAQLRKRINLEWQNLLIPTICAENVNFDGPTCVDVAVCFLGKKFDEVDLDDPRVFGESALRRFDNRAVAYYIGAYILQSIDEVRARETGFDIVDQSEIELMGFVFEGERICSALKFMTAGQLGCLDAAIRIYFSYPDIYHMFIFDEENLMPRVIKLLEEIASSYYLLTEK